MKKVFASAAVLVLVCLGRLVQADVFDLDPGLTNLETVTVGDPGNAGEPSGLTVGGYGPDRICGSVAYNYNIGKYEVTAAQYTDFLNKVAKTDTYGLYNTEMSRTDYGSGITRSGDSGSYTYSVASDFANRPVNYVSWGDAARFANWLHNGQPTGLQVASTTEDGAYYLNGAMTDAQLLAVNRKTTWKWAITSEDEWYKAAYYKGGSANAGYWHYQTGSDTAPGRDLADVSGNNANYYGNPYPIDSGKYTTVVGEFQNSDSPYGTFDQGGNVFEWNEGVLYNVCRGARGGSFDFYGFDIQASFRRFGYPSDERGNIGFRVAEALPEPSSLIVLAGGLAALLGLRRRR